MFTGALWVSSPYLRERVIGVYTESMKFETHDAKTSSGERIIFWTKSLRFIEAAPLFGHGTGSITEMFRRAAVGKAGARGVVSSNPHNQTFTVAIQIGLVGAVVLWAMWVSQLMLFRGPGLVAWFGTIFVVQNMVGSLFNSFISDFTEGWLFVLGVGVAGGAFSENCGRGVGITKSRPDRCYGGRCSPSVPNLAECKMTCGPRKWVNSQAKLGRSRYASDAIGAEPRCRQESAQNLERKLHHEVGYDADAGAVEHQDEKCVHRFVEEERHYQNPPNYPPQLRLILFNE